MPSSEQLYNEGNWEIYDTMARTFAADGMPESSLRIPSPKTWRQAEIRISSFREQMRIEENRIMVISAIASIDLFNVCQLIQEQEAGAQSRLGEAGA